MVASRINFRCLSTNDAPGGIVMAARELLRVPSRLLSFFGSKDDTSLGMLANATGSFFATFDTADNNDDHTFSHMSRHVYGMRGIYGSFVSSIYFRDVRG